MSRRKPASRIDPRGIEMPTKHNHDMLVAQLLAVAGSYSDNEEVKCSLYQTAYRLSKCIGCDRAMLIEMGMRLIQSALSAKENK